MEEISVKGEKYVKASVIAKKFGYTQDYVGQLCRGEQVKATLLGRSWYVNEESLIEHKKGRYRSNLAKSKEAVRKFTEEKLVIPSVPAVFKSPLIRSTYEEDQSDLLPSLGNRSVEPAISVANADEEKLEDTVTEEEVLSTESEENTDKSTFVAINKDISPVVRPPRPIVRTIPAPPKREVAVVSPVKGGSPAYSEALPARYALASILVFAVLFTEVALIVASLGLEKKLVTSNTGDDMVVYNFDPMLVATTIKSFVSK